MKTMQEYARQYQHQNRGKEVVDFDSVNAFSFKSKTVPKKDTEQPKSYVVMKSWFFEME